MIMTIIGEAEERSNLQYERLEWNSNPTKLQYVERIYILFIYLFPVQMWKESCLVNISWWSHNSIEKKISKNEVWCRVINEIVKHL